GLLQNDNLPPSEEVVPVPSRLSGRPSDVLEQRKQSSVTSGALFGDPTTRVTSRRTSNAPKQPEQPIEDTRIMRRIIAEDPTYNLATVAPLTDLCLKHCSENFAYNCSVMRYLDDRQKRILLDSLAPDMPLKVTAHVIGEDPYWTRCCHQRWPIIDLSRHGGSWKQAFFERMLEETIETFVPGHTYAPRLDECVTFAAPYVHRLDIRQLLPPLKQHSKDKISDEGSDEGSDSEFSSEPQLVDHLDLGPVLTKLEQLEELAISYTVKDCGMNFEWSIFQFTGHDCLNLCKAIQQHPRLRILHLTRSRVDSERCRVIVNHILHHPTLECLDLSHNFIGDRGAKALAKLISEQNRLRTLILTDNRLQATSGLSLAHALVKSSCQLERLNLRLNRLMDDGGVAIAKSMLRNTTIKELNLAANDLNETTASYFAHVLGHNKSLTHLDLSNNQLGPNVSKKLMDGMMRNDTLLYFDLRFTGSSQDAEYGICQQIERNQERMRQLLCDASRVTVDNAQPFATEDSLPLGVTSVANRHTVSAHTYNPILTI
ncbi:hypothetical protein P879_07421, partial [Paragonimus westermani]